MTINTSITIGSATIQRGAYTTPPPEIVTLTSSNGKELQLQLLYREIDKRGTIETNILGIQSETPDLVLTVDATFPEGVTKGKLSLTKHEIFLTASYCDGDVLNGVCSVIRDVTPYFGIPLLARGSVAPELFLNQAILMLEQEIKKLKDKIGG